jgi:hypothetical protein
MHTHATSRIGERGLQNRQKTKEPLGNIGIFPPKTQFSSHKIRFSSTAFRFLQQLSDFLQRLSAFFNGFPIFLNGFPLSEKSEKIYLRREVYARSLFELRIFCHSLSHSHSELRNSHYASTPVDVRQYASTPVDVRQYASTPVHQYASTPVRQYASRCMPVCQYAST